MNDRTVEYMTKTTPDLGREQIEQLKQIFPESVSEGQVDFDLLRATLGDAGALADENAYTFTWAGKQDAFRAIQTPSAASLAPAPEESVNWESTQHLFIEGENLEVLKLLYKSYFGKVKMIYIDPPYNTGHDFIYRDDYSQPRRAYLEKTGQMDAEGNVLKSNPETSGRYHSDWLSMMYPRLFLARQLLREDGLICISIGEGEMPRLRLLLDEVFGEKNRRNTILARRYNKNINIQFIEKGLTTLNVGAEYVLVYACSHEAALNPVYREASKERQKYGYWKGFWNSADRPTMRYELLGVKPETGQWKWSQEKALKAVENFREYVAKYREKMTLEQHWIKTGREKRFIRRNPSGTGMNQGVEHWIAPTEGYLRSSNWTDMLASDTLNDLGLEYDNPKNVELIKELVRMCTNEQALIIDFFAGSCTMAQATLELNREDSGNRRFIMVQLPEPTDNAEFPTIADIGKERIQRVIAQMQAEREGQLPLDARETPEDLGFKVFKLAPSTFRQWEAPEDDDAEALGKQLALFDRGLQEGVEPLHVIYEVALKQGYSLNARIEKMKTLKVSETFRVCDEDGKTFYICLDDNLQDATIDSLPLDKETTFVCLDTALDDSQKVNLAMQCLLKVI